MLPSFISFIFTFLPVLRFLLVLQSSIPRAEQVLSCHNFFDRTTSNFVRLSSHQCYAKLTSAYAQRRCKENVKESIFNYSETFTLIILIVKPTGYTCKLLTPWLAQSCEYKYRYNACLKSVTRYSISTVIINVSHTSLQTARRSQKS